jgi:hypothetical protein
LNRERPNVEIVRLAALSDVLLVAISRVNAYASCRIRRSLPADQGGNAALDATGV